MRKLSSSNQLEKEHKWGINRNQNPILQLKKNLETFPKVSSKPAEAELTPSKIKKLHLREQLTTLQNTSDLTAQLHLKTRNYL